MTRSDWFLIHSLGSSGRELVSLISMKSKIYRRFSSRYGVYDSLVIPVNRWKVTLERCLTYGIFLLTKSSISVRYLLQSCLKNIVFYVCTPSRVYLFDYLLCPILPFLVNINSLFKFGNWVFSQSTSSPLPGFEPTTYQVAVYEAAGLSMGQLASVNA